MSAAAHLADERATDSQARCNKEQIYGTKDKAPAYWGTRRAPLHPDERGAEAVIVGLGGTRFVFRRSSHAGLFDVSTLDPRSV